MPACLSFIRAGRRRTVRVAGEVGGGKDVSVHLGGDADFLAERPVCFRYRGFDADCGGGHCVLGLSLTP